MNTKTMIELVVGVVVGLIVLSAALMPVIHTATTTEKTFLNEGYYTMDAITESTTHVIEWEKSNPTILIIDDEPVDMSWTDVTKSYTLIGSDTMVVRYERGANDTAGVQMFTTTVGAQYLSFHSNSAATAGDKATITLSNSTVSFVTDGTAPLDKTITDIGTDAYVINPTNTGDYTIVMKRADTPAYVKGDSTIRFIGVSVSSGPNGIALYGIGTLDDGMTLSTIYTNNTVTDVAYSDPVPTDTAVSGYDDLYSLDKYNFTISYTDNGTPKTFDATYSYFLIPNEVTAEKSIHADATTIELLGVIPILIIVGLIVGIAAVVVSRRE